MIDQEIKKIIDYNYNRGYKILSENMPILENFAKLLIEKETIYTKEVDQVMAGVDYKEICEQIDKDNAERAKKDAERKEQQEHDQKLKLQLLKEQTAEALNNAGVISKEEFESIKAQGDSLRDQIVKAKAEKKAEKQADETEKNVEAEIEQKIAETSNMEEKPAEKNVEQPKKRKNPAKKKNEDNKDK